MTDQAVLRNRLEKVLEPHHLRLLALARDGLSDVELAASLGLTTADGVQWHKRKARLLLGGITWKEAMRMHRQAGFPAGGSVATAEPQ